MDFLDSDFQILKLTSEFYKAYPDPPFSEILNKNQRPYNCLLFQTHYDYYICVPFRTEITHKNAFLFNSSVRSIQHKSGLDYSKIVIITQEKYIDSQTAVIDKDEYREMIKNISKIKEEALAYVETYVNHMNGEKKIGKKKFIQKYSFSPLKYFHSELGIIAETYKTVPGTVLYTSE